MSAYQELERRFHRLANLEDAQNLLHWDQSTFMPRGGAGARAEQLATLRVVCHEILTAPDLGDLLERAASETLDDWQRANLREMRRRRMHATAVESGLVEAVSKAVSTCEMVWREARAAADFGAVRPSLAEVLALVKEVAAAKAETLGCTPYEALLDEWDPGGRAALIDPLFDRVETFLPDLMRAVVERQAREPAPLPLPGPFPLAAQRELGVRLMRTLGFDFEHGRLDVSVHPFCGGTPEDLRITTRYNEEDLAEGLMAILHETGHALYERGLPARWRRQPVGRARSMSLHESQSLLIEMQACRSREFIDHLAPVMREVFAAAGPAWEADNLYRVYTRVRPDFIRVDADEVTYPAHVLLRYRLERAMVTGDLAVEFLPEAWNDAMQRYLGLVPPNDALGCLQDIHWFDGAWGYFPTYTLGAMTAAQLFEAACAAEPEVLPAIAGGDFGPLLGWLRRAVHGRASLLSADDLVREASGRPLDAAAYERHLRQRYLS